MDFIPQDHDASQEPSVKSEVSARHRLLCAFASACVPGLGQWLLGKKRAAVVFLGAFLAATTMYWPLRIPRFWAGLVSLTLCSHALWILSSCNALRISSNRAAKGSSWWLLALIPVGLFAGSMYVNCLVRAAGFKFYYLPTSSMEPTIVKGDHIFVDLWQYRRSKPVPQQVVVFHHHSGNSFLKRLIAIGGQTVYGKDGEVFVDGKLLNEPYAHHLFSRFSGPFPEMNNFGPIQVPSGKLFVMGDNRDASLDSRATEFGLIDEGSVFAQPLYVLMSNAPRRNGMDLR